MNATPRMPVEVDTDLAAAHAAFRKAWEAIDSLTAEVQRLYGDRIGGYGQRTRYRTTGPEAWERVETAAANGDESKEVWSPRHRPAALIAERDTRSAVLATARERIDTLNAEYRGWSRFYVVTSSNGHVHATMSCRTCRATTTYGWLPQLSGLSEADAVAELGATLCSVCYPSAPLDWIGGRISKAQALKRAA